MCTERSASRRAAVALALLAAIAAAVDADRLAAWTVDGHAMVGRSAVEALPPSMPEFFRRGGAVVAHAAIDPDLFKARDAPALRDQESPEHYIDLEYLGATVPRPRRYDYLRQLAALELDPEKVGTLPLAIQEGVERLTLAFAEHRRFPDDPVIRHKALYFAGQLAHYAADTCQPLHTTIHFDGRVPKAGDSPRSGIHRLVDQLFGRVGLDRVAQERRVEPRVVSPLFDSILDEIAASHRLVDRVYELEPSLSWPAADPVPPAVEAFAADRYRASVTWVSSLFLTAWERSATVELPFWALDARRDGGA